MTRLPVLKQPDYGAIDNDAGSERSSRCWRRNESHGFLFSPIPAINSAGLTADNGKPAPLFGDLSGPPGQQRMESRSNNGASQQSQSLPQLPNKFNPMEGLSNLDVLNFLDSLQSTLRSSGFTESQIGEIMPAMQVTTTALDSEQP